MRAAPRFGIDGRWLTSGPPSGARYVRQVVAALAARPDATDLMVFARAGAREAAGIDRQLKIRTVPTMPSALFNTVGIPLATPSSVEAILYQNFTPQVSRAASVTVIHDLIFMRDPTQFTRAEQLYLGLIPRLLPRARVVAAVSEHVREQILERWPKRDPSSVVVAPNAVDDRLLREAAAGPRDADIEVRARYGVRSPYILYLGRINSRKNLARLVRAFAQSGLAEHRLVLAGAASGRIEDLLAVADASGVSHRVDMVGSIDDRDLGPLYRGADAFAYVSLDEGFGVPPLEAMAFGVPVVCSDIMALRETATGGGAIFVPPLDEIAIAAGLAKAAGDEDHRARARSQGPSHARSFSWIATAQVLRDALEMACR